MTKDSCPERQIRIVASFFKLMVVWQHVSLFDDWVSRRCGCERYATLATTNVFEHCGHQESAPAYVCDWRLAEGESNFRSAAKGGVAEVLQPSSSSRANERVPVDCSTSSHRIHAQHRDCPTFKRGRCLSVGTAVSPQVQLVTFPRSVRVVSTFMRHRHCSTSNVTITTPPTLCTSSKRRTDMSIANISFSTGEKSKVSRGLQHRNTS